MRKVETEKLITGISPTNRNNAILTLTILVCALVAQTYKLTEREFLKN